MFITFEGPEGSGKSTQIRLLADGLRAQGFDVVQTREPGGTPIGDQIRGVVHDIGNEEIAPNAELLLYSASRAQLVSQLIRPSLKAGKIVVCDRYYDSTMAYQGYGRGLDMTALEQITQFATNGLKPDLTLLLDVDIATGLQRKSSGDVEINRMDMQSAVFYDKVREGFYALMAQEPARWVLVNANRPIEDVAVKIWETVEKRLEAGD